MSAFTDEDYRRVLNERDEARASLAQIRRVFGNAIAFDDARGDIVKMAEIAYRGACDGDKAVGELRGMTRQRDEARAEVERLRKAVHTRACHNQSAYNLNCVCGADEHQRDLQKVAYRRGAEAMRELCEELVKHNSHEDGIGMGSQRIESAIRALSIPKEK